VSTTAFDSLSYPAVVVTALTDPGGSLQSLRPLLEEPASASAGPGLVVEGGNRAGSG